MGRHGEGVVVWLGQGQIVATVQAFVTFILAAFRGTVAAIPSHLHTSATGDLTASRAWHEYGQLHVQFDLSLVLLSFYVFDLFGFQTCFPSIHFRDRY